MKTKPTTTPTRISPQIATLFQMLNILFTIESFERRLLRNEESIRKCEAGANKYMHYYSQLKTSYEQANETFRERILQEEAEYNNLVKQIALLSIVPVSISSSIPELTIMENDDDISSFHNKSRFGGHSSY